MRLSHISLTALWLVTLVTSVSAGFFQPQIHKLRNGLTCIVIEDHRTPVVDVTVAYKVGSAEDPKGKSGLAHYLEHLMFKGIPGLKEDEFAKGMLAMGGAINAHTSYDFTVYENTLPKIHLEKILDWEARRMKELVLTRESAGRELQVVLSERSYRVEGSHSVAVNEVLRTQLYRHHPYRLPVIGWEHEIKTFSLEDALQFHRLWYHPNNAAIVLTGDITLAEATHLVEKYFGHLPAQEIPTRWRPKEPKKEGDFTATTHYLDPRATVPMIIKATLSEPYREEDPLKDRARDVLGILLADTKNSFLYQRLVEEEKVASDVRFTNSSGHRDYGELELTLILREGVSFARAEDALQAALQAFLKKEVTQTDVTKAVAQSLGRWEFLKDNVSECGIIIAHLFAADVSFNIIERAHEEMQKVTPLMVMQAAKEIFSKPLPVTVHLDLKKGEK